MHKNSIVYSYETYCLYFIKANNFLNNFKGVELSSILGRRKVVKSLKTTRDFFLMFIFSFDRELIDSISKSLIKQYLHTLNFSKLYQQFLRYPTLDSQRLIHNSHAFLCVNSSYIHDVVSCLYFINDRYQFRLNKYKVSVIWFFFT